MPLVEVAGNVGAGSPWQMGEIGLKVGVATGCMVGLNDCVQVKPPEVTLNVTGT
jgi:hypothetical protein